MNIVLTVDTVTDKIYELFVKYGMSQRGGGTMQPPTKQAIKNTLIKLCIQTHRAEIIKGLINDLELWRDDNLEEGESSEFGRGMDGAIEYLKDELKLQIERDNK